MKPLDLGNPFYTREHVPKRRVTLPSLVVGDKEATALAEAIPKTPVENVTDTTGPRAVSENVVAKTSGHNAWRRSRSADDLRRIASDFQPVRQRNEEIRYWRDSFKDVDQSAIQSLRELDQENDSIDKENIRPRSTDTTPQAGPSDLFMLTHPRPIANHVPSPPLTATASRPITSDGDTGSELEERVRKLEDGLLEFQRSIQRLTAESNRKTIIVDSMPYRLSRQHTPSVLVNTLRDSNYQPPQLESVEEQNRACDEQNKGLPPSSRTPSPPGRKFTPLYRIIADERSARRSLESQVRSLQQDLSEVQYQLSQPIMSRSSPMYTPQTVRQQFIKGHDRNYSTTSSFEPGNRVVSRFSQSDSLTDSEVAHMRENHGHGDDEPPSPYQPFATPMEHQRPFSHEKIEYGMF